MAWPVAGQGGDCVLGGGASLATNVPEGQGDGAALCRDQGPQPPPWPPLKAEPHSCPSPQPLQQVPRTPSQGSPRCRPQLSGTQFPLRLAFICLHFSCVSPFVHPTGQGGQGLSWIPSALWHLTRSSCPVSLCLGTPGRVAFPDARPSGVAYPACEWRYDACASPCFQTCRDPWAASCRDVPR